MSNSASDTVIHSCVNVNEIALSVLVICDGDGDTRDILTLPHNGYVGDGDYDWGGCGVALQ